MTTTARFRTSIEAYEAAWRTAGTESLSALFTVDATYHAAPLDEPLVGLDAIAVFWQDERDRPDAHGRCSAFEEWPAHPVAGPRRAVSLSARVRSRRGRS